MSGLREETSLRIPTPPSPEEFSRYLPVARAGDQAAFELLAEPYRRELLTHCYRMTGSFQDAEDLTQETYLRAWRRLDTYEGRASFRAWLYKIATNACLDALDRRPKRILPPARYAAADPLAPLAAPMVEPIWLEPFPDELLAPTESGPETRFDAHESITLSFLVALQLLPPRQRCVLIMSDVLDWRANEIAKMLGVTLSAVNSLLHRARLTLEASYRSHPREAIRAAPGDEKLKTRLDFYVRAWQSADVDGIVSLLKEDAIFAMPPLPAWYQGRTAIKAFISGTILAGYFPGRWRILPLEANAQPAFAWYQQESGKDPFRAFSIQVLTFDGPELAQMTTFMDPALFPLFGLPSQLE